MGGKIFINYRRGESIREAEYLYTQLQRHFPEKRLFIDRHGIEGGTDWLHVLERQIAQSAAMIVLIGKDWASAKDEHGRRRLDNDADFVRFEIADALRRNVPILPVLLDGASMPSPAELPPNLLLLVRSHAMQLRQSSLREDAERVAVALKHLIDQQRRFSPWAISTVIAAALLAGILTGPWLLTTAGLPMFGVETAGKGESEPSLQKRLAAAQTALAKSQSDLNALDLRRSKEFVELKEKLESTIANERQAAAQRIRELERERDAARTQADQAPERADARSSTSCFQASSNEPDTVIRLCTQIINQRPDQKSYERALNRRGLAYRRTDRLKEALADFDALIASNKTEPGYLDNRQSVHRALGNLEQALKDANEAVRLAPKTAWFYHDRGLVLFDLNRLDAAIADFTTALTIGGKDFGISNYERGRAYAKLMKYDLAINDFSAAYEKDSALVLSLRERGLTYAETGSNQLAEADLTSFLQQLPDDKDAQLALAKLKSKKK
jgi:tetratricopeptide (TPR) repeat protein